MGRNGTGKEFKRSRNKFRFGFGKKKGNFDQVAVEEEIATQKIPSGMRETAARMMAGQFDMNDMLAQCGFMTLDPRSPFDWVILYCICVEDMFDVDIRMKSVFQEMFGGRS